MAVTVNNLKLTQVQGVVSVRGTAATGTIDLNVTLKKSTETASSPAVNIKGLHWTLSSGASAKVQRNSVVLYELAENGSLDMYGYADNSENTSDIEVVIAGGAGGTVIVDCAKVSGFGSQQHQNAPLDTNDSGDVYDGGSLG
jgi:hypothetical protein|tara:strand:+ start:9598 stop:10023 length:426 start_codon:yes stop_codon:yes gene_type:complete